MTTQLQKSLLRSELYREENNTLWKDNTNLKNQNTVLKSQNSSLIEQISKLKQSSLKYQEEFDSLRNRLGELSKEPRNQEQNIEILSRVINQRISKELGKLQRKFLAIEKDLKKEKIEKESLKIELEKFQELMNERNKKFQEVKQERDIIKKQGALFIGYCSVIIIHK